MTKTALVRIALAAAICGLFSACKSSKISPETAPGPEPHASANIPVETGSDTSAPFPPGDGPADAELSFTRHKIAKGDTFYAIARKYGTDVKDVIAANPGVDPKALRIGQEVLVPVAK